MRDRCAAGPWGPRRPWSGRVSCRDPEGHPERKGGAMLFSSSGQGLPAEGAGPPQHAPLGRGCPSGEPPPLPAPASSLLTGRSSVRWVSSLRSGGPVWRGCFAGWPDPGPLRQGKAGRRACVCTLQGYLPPQATHPGDTGIYSPAGPGPLPPCVHPRG